MASSISRLRTAALVRTFRCSPAAWHFPQTSACSFSSAQPAPKKLSLPADATTVGRLMDYINSQCKNDTTDAHVQALVKVCNEPKDFNSLAHSIITYKRTRQYIMSTETANLTMHQVLQKHTPLEGPLWILEHFKERTGLFYSLPTGSINWTLDRLYWQVNLLKNNEELTDETKERVWKALEKLTEKIVARGRPKKFKKRKKRRYYRDMQLDTPQRGPRGHTARRAADIGLLVNTAEDTWQTLVKPMANVCRVDVRTKIKLEMERGKERGDKMMVTPQGNVCRVVEEEASGETNKEEANEESNEAESNEGQNEPAIEESNEGQDDADASETKEEKKE